MTALSDLLVRSNVDGWSTREIARRAEKNEHTLAQPTVSKYMSGRHGKPTEAVLAAFSDVLNIPIDKLREAAGVPTGAESPWTPPSEANRLDLRQRRALEELIRSMVTSETIGEDQTNGNQDATRMGSEAQPDGLTRAGTGRIRDIRSRSSERRPRLLDDDDVDDILEHPYAADDSEDPGEDDD